MRDLFPGYFKASEEDVKQIWESCLFVFDTNVLLNLYRYSDKQRNEFLTILESINDRVWLPNRVAEEYLSNRLSAIDGQEKSYDKMIGAIETLKKDLENSNQHPFISSKMLDEFSISFDKLINELTRNKKVHTNRINNDDVRDRVLDIFNNKVGLPYSNDKLEEIIKDGKVRYQHNIPPGYKDSSKPSDGSSLKERCRPYGDLIIWLQIIDKAREDKRSIIFITNDRKEDWLQIFKGKIIGVRPELVSEFENDTNEQFLLYQPEGFLKTAKNNLNAEVSDDLFKETREIKEREDFNEKKMSFKKPNGYIDGDDLNDLQQKINNTKDEIRILKTKYDIYIEKNLAIDNVYNQVSEQIDRGFLVDDEGRFQSLTYDLKYNELEMESLRNKINALTNHLTKLEVVLAHKKMIMKNQEF